MNDLFVIYLVIVNLAGLSIMAYDKNQSRHGQWRIPERMLFGIAAVGGSVGVWAGMYIFSHKTRHNAFRFGIPLLISGQLAIGILISLMN